MVRVVRRHFRKLRLSKAAPTMATPLQNEVLSLRNVLAVIKENGVVFIAVVYALGLAITNIYLGSVGVVSLELVRTRYLIVGMLFIGFVASVAVPFSGYIYIAQTLQDKSGFQRFVVALGYGFICAFALEILLSLLDLLSGDFQGRPDVLPQISGGLGAAIFVALMFLFMIAIYWFSELRFGNSAREHRGKWAIRISGLLLQILLFVAIMFFLIFALLIVLTVFNTIYVWQSPLARWLPSLGIGWLRFFFGSLALQTGFFITYTIVLYFRKRSTNQSTTTDDSDHTSVLGGLGTAVFSRFRASSYGLLLLVGIFLPLYALFIYPSLPQQFGGGSGIPVVIIPVESNNSDDGLAACLSHYETFLVDRTSDTFILLLEEDSIYRSEPLTQSIEVTTTVSATSAYTLSDVARPCFIPDSSMPFGEPSEGLRYDDETRFVLEVPSNRIGAVQPKRSRFP